MKLHELYPFAEEAKKRKRLGRGPGSGFGCTAGKGNKGQKARAGSGPAVGFEGGQMPLTRRVPKRGFKNLFKKPVTIFNLGQIEKLFPEKDDLDPNDFWKFSRQKHPVKVLGNGQIKRKVKIRAHSFSASARQKIEDAGGEAIIVERSK